MPLCGLTGMGGAATNGRISRMEQDVVGYNFFYYSLRENISGHENDVFKPSQGASTLLPQSSRPHSRP